MSIPLPLISVSGSYGEMGVAYARQCKTAVGQNLQDYMRRFHDVVGLREDAVKQYGAMYREIVSAYNPDIADMLIGIADGADQMAELIFALNARTELLYGLGHREDACTSLAVLPSHTSDGHTWLGQNWDWHPEQKRLSLLLRTVDEDGFVVLTLAEAGMVAKAGINSAGIGVCGNLLVSSADKAGVGVPYHCILRGVLQSRSMAEALRAAADTERVSSGNVLIADGQGEAIDLELMPGNFGHLYPTEGLIAHANHFESTMDVHDLRKARSALSLLRPQRVRHLLENNLIARSVDRENIEAVFRDHYSYPNGICRHVDSGDSPVAQIASLFSIIIDAAERDIFVAGFPVCESEYHRISLSDADIGAASKAV